MKNMKINLFALALVIGGTFVTSCNEDDATGNSVLEVNSGVTGSVVTDFDSSAALTVNEVDEETFTYMVSISEAQPVDIHLTVSQISGSATPDEDFTFDSVVVIPAYATTASGSISILNDLTPESLESFTLQIGGVNTSNATIPVKTVTFNIVNELSNELKLDFHFNRTFSGSNGFSSSLCEIESIFSAEPYDVDFIVYDSMGNDLGVLDAQTANCEESLTMNINDYADGIYDITAYLYTNADLDLAELAFPLVDVPEFMIPITVDYLRSGSFSGLYTQEVANQFTSNSPVDSESYLMSIEVYTDAIDGVRKFRVLNSAGNISAEGRARAARTFNHVRRNK